MIGAEKEKGMTYMAYYTVGELIRDARERQKYSQEELSYGICTTSTLSRIENGLQVPGRKILEGLMQRLGLTIRADSMYLSQGEREQCELEQELARSLRKGNFEQAEKIADRMEENIRKNSGKRQSLKAEEQYLNFARVLIGKYRGEPLEWVLKELLNAIHMTMPEFDGHIRARLLTCHEIAILYSIGCTCYSIGRRWDSLQLLSELKEYMECRNPGGEEMSARYLMVIQKMSSWLYQAGMYKDALAFCQTGIEHCIEFGKLHTLPALLHCKACGLAELGQYDMSEQYFFQSIALFQMINQRERAEEVREYARLHYGLASAGSYGAE